MRVPLPLVLLFCLAVIGGVWWYGTRQVDFLTPPTAEKLAAVRARVESSLPQADHPGDAVSVPPVTPPPEPPPPPPVEEPKPAIELGDLASPPTLREYGDLAPKGAAHLIELAVLLEAEGEFQRALLAWERVLDLAKPDESQTRTAIIAIKRLRPTLPDWNKERAKVLAITLHASTGNKTATTLKPILVETAKDLERASSGILKVTASVTSAPGTQKSTRNAPVALSFKGPNKDSVSTEVLTFTLESPKSLPDNLRKTVFQLLRGYLGHAVSLTPPAALADGESPLEAFNNHITRLGWKELGTLLNRPPK